jgi:predicted dehydrogenase
MWGIQTLKQMLNAQELGDLICIEGRYWQSSTALRAITPEGPLKPATWKNDSKLSGPSDAFLDVGVHWVDAVSFLMGEAPQGGKVWLSYANAEAAHRDSHVQLNLEFSAGRRAMGSISKNFHGANNHFEINLIGTQKSATWTFLNPDEIWLGHGTSRTLVTRKDNQLGSKQPPFHGLGWLEGYMEIIRQVILQGEEKPPLSYPTLSEHLNMLQAILSLKNN